MSKQEVLEELERRSRNIICRDPIELVQERRGYTYTRKFPSQYDKLLTRMNPGESFDECWAYSPYNCESRRDPPKSKRRTFKMAGIGCGKFSMKHVVYTEFIGDLPLQLPDAFAEKGIIHSCGNNECFNPDHIKLADYLEYCAKGEALSNLTELQARAIRMLANAGMPTPDIGRVFPDIRYPVVYNIATGKTWAWLDA